MTKSHNTKLFTAIVLCIAFTLAIGLSTTCFACDDVPARVEVPAQELTGVKGWLATYNESLGMHHASIITTIFGAAFVAFFIAIVWGKLVELYGALGGLIGGGSIVGTFWIFNHKLPFGCGLIEQGGPWVDMGLAVFAGLFTASLLDRLRAKKLDPTLPGTGGLLADAFPRLLAVILGGMAGGAIVGLIGFTGADWGPPPSCDLCVIACAVCG